MNNVFSKEGLQKIHSRALEVLETVGMRIAFDGYYDALLSAGATVDRKTKVVKFPKKLVEQTIENIRKKIQAGQKQIILNGIMSSKTEPGLKLKFAGACIEYLDPLTNEVKTPTAERLIKLIKFGESIPEVDYVGNPLCYLEDEKGQRIPGELQRVLTAGLVARYTTKYGSNEVWNDAELDLLIELGTIVRGSLENYYAKPCFITAKETISPLLLPEEDGKILYMLAKRNLPCTIIPMPISGVTSPMSISGNIAMGTAEILGVMTCINVNFPDAMVAGGVISGTMDMKTSSAAFGAPETILQDLGIAMLFESLYGQDFGMGTGYIDAMYPGVQSAIEIYAKMRAAHETGRYNYACGLLLSGKRWSPIQALLSIEIAKYINRNYADIDYSDDSMPLELFAEVGISGDYLGEMHTYDRFRDAVWMPNLMQRNLIQLPDVDAMIEKAKDTWSDFEKNCRIDEPAVPNKILKEIEEWENKATMILTAR